MASPHDNLISPKLLPAPPLSKLPRPLALPLLLFPDVQFHTHPVSPLPLRLPILLLKLSTKIERLIYAIAAHHAARR